MEPIQRRGDLSWFKALEKQWENRPKRPASPAAVVEPQTKEEEPPNVYRERLVAFYQKHNPTKLNDVDHVLTKYQGKEEELFAKLEQRYAKDDRFPSPPAQSNGPVCFLQFSNHEDTPIKIQLFADIAPLAAENFRQLCRSKYRNSKIHRIVRGMCIQGGDYTTGDGTGGRSIYPPNPAKGIDMWGNFPDEKFSAHDAPGLLSMANNGPNRNGSQFFITLAPAKHLNGKHVVFGRVIEHLDVVLSIGQSETNSKDRPVQDITIVDCGEILDNGDWQRASQQQPKGQQETTTTFASPTPIPSFSSKPSPFGGTTNANFINTEPKALTFGALSAVVPPTSFSAFQPTGASMFGGSTSRDDVADASGAEASTPPFRFHSSTTSDVRDSATLFGGSAVGSTFGQVEETPSNLQQTSGDANVMAKMTFNFGGSQDEASEPSTKAPGGFPPQSSFGSLADQNDATSTFGGLQENAADGDISKPTFGGMAEGLSFGALAVSGNTKSAFTFGKQDSTFEQSSSSFVAGNATKPSVFGQSVKSDAASACEGAVADQPSQEGTIKTTSAISFGVKTQGFTIGEPAESIENDTAASFERKDAGQGESAKLTADSSLSANDTKPEGLSFGHSAETGNDEQPTTLRNPEAGKAVVQDGDTKTNASSGFVLNHKSGEFALGSAALADTSGTNGISRETSQPSTTAQSAGSVADGKTGGLLGDRNHIALTFGDPKDSEVLKTAFGGTAEGLSFGSVALSGNNNAAFAFGKHEQGKPSLEQSASITSSFAALNATKPSVFSGSSPATFGSPQDAPKLGFSSTSMFGTADERQRDKLTFRTSGNDSETVESEDSGGSEYVDNSVSDSCDEEGFDEYHYASGDEQISGSQPLAAFASGRSKRYEENASRNAGALREVPGRVKDADPAPRLHEGSSNSIRDNLNLQTVSTVPPISNASNHSSVHSLPDADLLSKQCGTTKSPKSDYPPESRSRLQGTEVETTSMQIPNEVFCERDASVELDTEFQQLPAGKHHTEIPDEVICGSSELPDHKPTARVDDDASESPALEHTDTMPVDNTTDEQAQKPMQSKYTTAAVEKNRPPERIEFEAGEKSSNVSFESHYSYTPSNSRIDEYDRSARQSAEEGTVESEILNSTATVDSSVSGQAELLRRDIEVCSLDIKEALRRVERQKERVRTRQASSLTSTPTRYSRSLLPLPDHRPQSLDNEVGQMNDVDPSARFVYLSRIANKLSSSTMSRRSLPDDIPRRRENASYTSPVLVQDAELETMQRESRSVQPLVDTFERWTKDHVEKQKNDLSSLKQERTEKNDD